MTALTFDPKEHRYYLDGAELPGVTRIIHAAGLIDDTHWSDWHAQRGSAVHSACELLDRGRLNRDTVDERITGYLDAWERFTAEKSPNWLAIEERVHCPMWRYAGTLDRLGTISGRRRSLLLDIKTGDPGRAVELQLAGYWGCMCDGMRMPEAASIWLRPNGTYKLDFYGIGALRNALQVFTGALNVLRWKGEIE